MKPIGPGKKRIRKRECLHAMNPAAPKTEQVSLIALHAPAMEEMWHEVALFREFAGLDVRDHNQPDESTNFWFGHLLDWQDPGQKVLVTVNKGCERALEKLRTDNCNQWDICLDADPGLVLTQLPQEARR